MSGILGLLWWDIRGNRNEMKDFKEGLENLLKIEYISKTEHEYLCEIDTLRTEKCFRKALEEHSEKILTAIKNNK